MSDQTQAIALSDHDLKVIKEALFTQEKILEVQSRAGGNATKIRLNQLQELLHRLRCEGGTTAKPQISLWGQFTRIMSN